MNKEVEKLAENKAVECFPNGTAGDTHFDYLQELRREGFEEGFIEGYKAAINAQGLGKRYIYIRGMIMELIGTENLNDSFVFEWNGEYQLQITNVDGVLKVTNAVNGWGNNCKDEFENTEVEILEKVCTPITKAAINTQQNGYNQELNGWVALFKDEQNYLDFLKWQKEHV